jgi:hypothetical protein
VAHHQTRGMAMAIVGAVAGLGIGYIAFLGVGLLTGAFGICGTVPEWWQRSYSWFGALLLASAAWGAIKLRRAYLKHHGELGA